jgi:hypothetical protein
MIWEINILGCHMFLNRVNALVSRASQLEFNAEVVATNLFPDLLKYWSARSAHLRITGKSYFLGRSL